MLLPGSQEPGLCFGPPLPGGPGCPGLHAAVLVQHWGSHIPREGSVLGRLGWLVTLLPGVQGQLSEAQLCHRRVGSSSLVPAL